MGRDKDKTDDEIATSTYAAGYDAAIKFVIGEIDDIRREALVESWGLDFTLAVLATRVTGNPDHKPIDLRRWFQEKYPDAKLVDKEKQKRHGGFYSIFNRLYGPPEDGDEDKDDVPTGVLTFVVRELAKIDKKLDELASRVKILEVGKPLSAVLDDLMKKESYPRINKSFASNGHKTSLQLLEPKDEDDDEVNCQDNEDD